SGFGDYKIGKYGADFLQVVKSYSKEQNLESRIQLKSPKRERRNAPAKNNKDTGSTRYISLQLYQQGNTIPEIASIRGISPVTVETHLASFIATGELDIDRFVPGRKLEHIVDVIRSTGQTSAMKPIKDLLSDDYSYGEIRMALEYYKSRM